MIKCFHHRRLYRGGKIIERVRIINKGTQGNRIYKIADNVRQIGAGASRCRRADYDIFFACIFMQQDFKGGQQRHVKRKSSLVTEPF